jgi:hypothetical protein
MRHLPTRETNSGKTQFFMLVPGEVLQKYRSSVELPLTDQQFAEIERVHKFEPKKIFSDKVLTFKVDVVSARKKSISKKKTAVAALNGAKRKREREEKVPYSFATNTKMYLHIYHTNTI